MPPQFNSQFNPVNNQIQENNPVPQKSSRKHCFLITLTILLILTGIFGAWYFSNHLTDEETEGSTSFDKTQDKSLITSKFADWKTYKNEEYGFEFEYPNTWFVNNVQKIEKGSVISFYAPFTAAEWEFYKDDPPPPEQAYQERLSVKIENEPQSDSRINNLLSKSPDAFKKMDMDGAIGVKFGEEVAYISKNNVFYTIGLRNFFSDSQDEKETEDLNRAFDQILSTFEFISTSTIPTIGTSTPDTINKSDAQQGSYKPGSVIVILKVGVNQTNFDKFIKNYNLKILSEVKGVYVEIGVPDGKEQIFVNLFESVSGVESAMLNSSPSLTN